MPLDPAALLLRFRGRSAAVHLKNMNKLNKIAQDNALEHLGHPLAVNIGLAGAQTTSSATASPARCRARGGSPTPPLSEKKEQGYATDQTREQDVTGKKKAECKGAQSAARRFVGSGHQSSLRHRRSVTHPLRVCSTAGGSLHHLPRRQLPRPGQQAGGGQGDVQDDTFLTFEMLASPLGAPAGAGTEGKRRSAAAVTVTAKRVARGGTRIDVDRSFRLNLAVGPAPGSGAAATGCMVPTASAVHGPRGNGCGLVSGAAAAPSTAGTTNLPGRAAPRAHL